MCRQLGKDVTERLVCALVLSRLDYCNVVLAGLPASTLAPLQRVLHVAARVLLDLKPWDNISFSLRQLHWLPIAERVIYTLCLLVHNAAVERAPAYISDLFSQPPLLHRGPRCELPVVETMSCHGQIEDSQIKHSALLHHGRGTNCRLILK